MRNECGSTLVANIIWAIGLPFLPPLPTEQRREGKLSAQDLEAISEATQNILDWLDRVATAIHNHHETKEYEEALRKSGTHQHQSGLSAAEQKSKAAKRSANKDMQTAKDLARQWDAGTLTNHNLSHWQRTLLRAYLNGDLQQRLKDVASSADTMCRTPQFA